jgi:DNA polymerase-3 subunit gamma/tau
LVCKDNETLKLLEVSDEIKTKYQEQANKCAVGFLMSALTITNQCDLYFKNSKNQRLHVELALMKLSLLNQVTNVAQLTDEIKKKVD